MNLRQATISFLLALAWSALPPLLEAQVLPSFGRDRAGTSGFQFLKIPVDARSAGMGQTVASNAFDATALFWNPALVVQIPSKSAAGVGYTRYHADVNLGYAAALRRIGSFMVGLSVQTLDSGTMDVTTEFQPFGTGETFKFLDMGIGLSVAQELTDLFSYGITARYVEENVAEVSASTVVFDAGIFYRVGSTGAQMAVSIRNFGFDSSSDGTIERTVVGQTDPGIEDDFESMTPPTMFHLGLTYDVFHGEAARELIVSVELTNPNDNAESFNLGLEYTWQRLLALRTGYRFGVEESDLPSFGLGILLPGVGHETRFDYGFNRLERLGSVHRIGLEVQL